MTYRLSVNRDGADYNYSEAQNLPTAITKAAELTGYTERTVREYIYGKKPGWNHPADSFVLPVKGERNREGVAVWIDILD